MIIKQDPVSGLYCREDGMVLMPPSGKKFKTFRWTFGAITTDGYKVIKFRGKIYRIHQIVCRAFNGPPPAGKSEVDHVDRCKTNNASSNLRWASRKENTDNRDFVDQSIAKYKARECEDKKAYMKARYKLHCEETKAYHKAYWAAKAAEMKSKGLTHRKGPDGRWGWYPFKRS